MCWSVVYSLRLHRANVASLRVCWRRTCSGALSVDRLPPASMHFIHIAWSPWHRSKKHLKYGHQEVSACGRDLKRRRSITAVFGSQALFWLFVHFDPIARTPAHFSPRFVTFRAICPNTLACVRGSVMPQWRMSPIIRRRVTNPCSRSLRPPGPNSSLWLSGGVCCPWSLPAPWIVSRIFHRE